MTNPATERPTGERVTRDMVTPDIAGTPARPGDRLATLDVPQDGCTAPARAAAAQRLRAMGMPGRATNTGAIPIRSCWWPKTRNPFPWTTANR